MFDSETDYLGNRSSVFPDSCFGSWCRNFYHWPSYCFCKSWVKVTKGSLRWVCKVFFKLKTPPACHFRKECERAPLWPRQTWAYSPVAPFMGLRALQIGPKMLTFAHSSGFLQFSSIILVTRMGFGAPAAFFRSTCSLFWGYPGRDWRVSAACHGDTRSGFCLYASISMT